MKTITIEAALACVPAEIEEFDGIPEFEGVSYSWNACRKQMIEALNDLKI